MTPRTVLILCERAPVKVNPVPAVREGWRGDVAGSKWSEFWRCGYCGRRVQVVA